MKRIGKFHKVSKERFVADWMDAFEGATVEEAEKIYEGIRLPRRATAGSAGYDFFSPVDFTIKPGETVKLSKKRSWIQIPPAAEQYRWNY